MQTGEASLQEHIYKNFSGRADKPRGVGRHCPLRKTSSTLVELVYQGRCINIPGRDPIVGEWGQEAKIFADLGSIDYSPPGPEYFEDLGPGRESRPMGHGLPMAAVVADGIPGRLLWRFRRLG